MDAGAQLGTSPSGEAWVKVQRADEVTTVVLNRSGHANALDAVLVEQLLDVVTSAAQDGTRALVLRSAAAHFCGGFDMDGVLQQSEGDLLLRFVRIEQLLQRLRNAPFLTVACVAGKAVGAGADLVAACTYRFLTPGSTLRFPGFRFGVALGTRHLAELVGTQASRDILLSSREVDAAAAIRIGLATRIVAEGDFDAAVDELIASAGPLDNVAITSILDRTARRDDAGDMATLVASVARPGLHDRLAAYLRI